MPIYFPNDESNMESTDDVTCIDDNSSNVSEDSDVTDDITCIDDNSSNVSEDSDNGNNESSDDEISEDAAITAINSNTQSVTVTSPEMMNKQALLKELEKQKQRIINAVDMKKQSDSKQMNHDNLGNMKSPVKRKRQRHTAIRTHVKKYCAKLDEETKREKT